MGDVFAWVGAGGMAVTGLFWLARLEGRVDRQEQRHLDLIKNNDEKHEQHERRHNEIRGDLSYIRSVVDVLARTSTRRD